MIPHPFLVHVCCASLSCGGIEKLGKSGYGFLCKHSFPCGQRKIQYLFCQHMTEDSGNRMISAVFVTFKKSFDPHKLRLHLTPKAFFFDAFQKLPSGNTGPTHTVTHTTNCAERAKEHRRGNRFLSGALLACGSYRICAMKLPIFSAAFCCICRVAWV